jgi:hypothetical protein
MTPPFFLFFSEIYLYNTRKKNARTKGKKLQITNQKLVRFAHHWMESWNFREKRKKNKKSGKKNLSGVEKKVFLCILIL